MKFLFMRKTSLQVQEIWNDGEFAKWLLSPLDQKSFQELVFKAFQRIVNVVVALIDSRWDRLSPGADPGFFSGGGAPLRNGVTDWWGKQILKANTKKHHLRGRGAHPLDPPLDPDLFFFKLRLLIFRRWWQLWMKTITIKQRYGMN